MDRESLRTPRDFLPMMHTTAFVRQRSPVGIAIVALSLLGACSGPRIKLEKCHKPQEYQQAQIGPMVRMPAGLKPLDPELRLEIPYGPTNTTPTPPGQPCLVEPPPYMERGPN